MEGKENISEELRLISGFVAGISRETPYALPEGYFEGLADKVLERVRTPIYSVPAGYFEGFAEKLMGRIKAEIPSPPGEAEMSSPLEELAMLSPFLSRIDKKMPFEVPEGYFSSLPVLTTRLAMDDQTDLHQLNQDSLLAGLKNIPVYQAPEGYFNELADTILEKVKQQDREQQNAPGKQQAPARVVSFGRRRNWWKYAAAAVVTGLILTGGWLKLHNSPLTAPADITKSLSNVSDQEIESYLDNQNLPLADDLANSTASVDITESDIKSLLGDVPDGELKEYIDEHGDVKDPVTN